MTSQRLWIYRLISLIVIPVVLLGTLEAGLRLLGSGYSTDFTTESVVDGVTVRRENARFSWQFFPAEIARGPLIFSFPAEKAENTYRIFVLGGSAGQGDPEPSYGFSRILELMLEHRYPDLRFEMVNAAMTAINSHVVYQIAREITPFQADLFILYLGSNEVVGPYGAGTVFAPLAPNLSFIRFMISAKSSRLGQSLARLSSFLQPDREDLASWRGMEMFLDQEVRADDPGMEQVYSHFRANLEDTLGVIGRVGANSIVSTIGTNLQDSAPFASQHRRPFPEQAKARWAELFDKGAALAEAGRYAEASVSLLAAEELDDSYAELQFLLGRCFQAMGSHGEALRRYRLARDLDTLRFRADTRINQIIRDLASNAMGAGVFLVDGAAVFESGSADGIPGSDLFYDHVHMTFEGNYLLAKSLLHQIEKILSPEGDRPAEEGDRFLTVEECRQGLAFTDFDRHRISQEMLQRFQKPPFTNQLDHRSALERVRRKEEKLRRVSTTPDSILAAVRRYEKAIERSHDDPWLHYNFGMLLYSVGNFEAAAEQFRILLASLPHHSVARERLLAALIHLGSFGEAVNQSREALRLEPDFDAAKYTLALAYSRMDRPGEAIALYRELLQHDPDRSPDIYNQLGQLYLQQARYGEAIEAFEEGMNIDRDAGHGSRPDMSYNLGVALKRNGGSVEATRAFSGAVAGYLEELRKNPNSARLHLNLGSVYVEMRDFRRAAESFRVAAANDPANLQAHMHLGKSLVVQGRVADAREALAAGVAEMTRRGQTESAQLLQRYRSSLQSKEAPSPRKTVQQGDPSPDREVPPPPSL